ncbi:MAG: MetQ/NlpA family ABC transporter substrate-binding protein [Eubacteriales bacterium]
MIIFFQHYPYLVSFNQEKHTDIVSAASIHFEPLGIYSEKVNSLAEIEKGAVVIIPDDTTNAARALLLLEACGMITVRTEAGITATIEDIITNPLELEFRAMQAEEIINAIEEADVVCMNGNYALEGGVVPVF